MVALNINSESWCRKAYLNYHCYGNTMGLTARDMGQITQHWSGRLESWQNSVSSDETEYDFDDSEYENYKSEGAEAGKEVTGYDGKKGGAITQTAGNFAVGAGGAIWTAASGGINAIPNIAKSGKNFFSKASWGSGKGKGKGNGSAYVQAGLAIAMAALYFAQRPNKEAKKACDALQPEMQSAQNTLTTAQSDMQTATSAIESLSDDAYTYNEEGNEEMAELKAEYDFYYEVIMNIQAKIDSGKPLTESEKNIYEEFVGYLGELGILIQEASETTTDEVSELYDEMGDYQEVYDAGAEAMGQVQGLTDYAASFDQATKVMCIFEGVSQSMNALSGIMAGARLLGMGWWNAIIAAASIAAGGLSTKHAVEQFQMAKDVQNEINLREQTQTTNEETLAVYDEQIDYYTGYMEGVEDLELLVPEDIEAPEDIGIPTTAGAASSGEDNPKPKPKDDEE